MTAAIRSMPEWMASDMILTEPLKIPGNDLYDDQQSIGKDREAVRYLLSGLYALSSIVRNGREQK